MKKLLPIFFILFLFSCKKEDLKDNSNNNSDIPTPVSSTIKLSYQPLTVYLHHCYFTYTDVNGIYYQNLSQDDMIIENVDFSKPFSVQSSAGLTFYDQFGSYYSPYNCTWQLKKDGVVIDIQTVSNYTYQN